MTADAVQSLAISHANGSVTLFLPLNQPLPQNAVTLNMTKYNTVSTNRSDGTGNIVTEMVTWGTSAVFGELNLVTREIHILVLPFLTMMHVRTYYIIEFYQLRLLNSTFTLSIYTYTQYIHEVFHSFSPTSPSKVTTWWGVANCGE